MKTSIYLPLLLGVLAMVPSGRTAQRAGLQKIAIAADERVWEFDIRIHGARIVGVLEIPPGWKITVENFGESALYKEGGAEVCGCADLGHDALAAEDLSRLGGFLLIEPSAAHGAPPEFSGTITLSGPNNNRTLQLGPEHFARVEADTVRHSPGTAEASPATRKAPHPSP